MLAAAAAAWAQAGDGPPPAWRPFNDTSPWNTPIARGAKADAASARIMETLVRLAGGDSLGVNVRKWSVPVYWVDAAAAPRHDVTVIPPWVFNKVVDADGDGVAEAVPIPDGAAPDPMGDGHMCVADWRRGVAYDFLQAEQPAPGEWQARAVDFWNLNGGGVHPPGVPSCRGSGFPLLAGLILPHELEQGEIRHALALGTPNNLPDRFLPPASATDGHAVARPVLPEGARLQLDPALDLDALGLSPAGKVIARALQVYGAYVADNCGGFTLYAENTAAWNDGLRVDEVGVISARWFRVLKMGAPAYQAGDPTKREPGY